MAAEFEEALAEVNKFLEQAQTNLVKQSLNDLKQNLNHRIEQAKFKAAASAPSRPPVVNSGRPFVKLTTYAYDESENFVKLYYTLNGIQQLPADRITSNFTDDSFDVSISDLDGKDYSISAKGFTHPIDPAKSVVKQKSDSLLVMLKKATNGTWSELLKIVHSKKTEEKLKTDAAFDESDPSAGLMNMMKKLYDEGDDDMKRSLKKAWFESQNKKMGGGGLPGGDLGLDL